MKTRIVQTLFTMALLIAAAMVTTTTKASLSPVGRVVPAGSPAAVKFTSLYTNLKTQCWADGKAGEGQDQALKCKGYGGYVIKVGYSAASSHMRIELAKSDAEPVNLPAQPINYDGMGRKIEWRLANGKPFAVILRIDVPKDGLEATELWQPGNQKGQSMLVQGLGKYSDFTVEIDAKKPNANVEARQQADAKYGSCN
ncbi:MAG: hypothetical protein ABIP75_01035 [Pyrinomonadaceae bacterium]